KGIPTNQREARDGRVRIPASKHEPSTLMLWIRHLRLRAITRDRPYGADLIFSPGLNVVHAGNTSGKSTCLQAVIYALGLERALGPQLEIPLPYAMREQIHRRRDDAYEAVIESYVELEIENASQDVLVIRRDVVGGKDSKLIRTWSNAKLVDVASRGAE